MNDLDLLRSLGTELEPADGALPRSLMLLDVAAPTSRAGQRLRPARTSSWAAMGLTAAATVAAVTLVATGNLTGTHGNDSAALHPSAGSSLQASASPTIELMAYTGKQVPGYKVAWMPRNWVIQGGSPTSLTIAPKTAKNTDSKDYAGKLVLGLVWNGFQPITPEQAKREGLTAQSVDGRPGWLAVDPDTMTAAEAAARKLGKGSSTAKYVPYMKLTYQGAKGTWLYIQVPKSVGWTGSEMAKFASGVTVLKNAAQSY